MTRRFLLASLFCSQLCVATELLAQPVKKPDELVSVAGITSVFRRNSHADVIIGRVLQGYSLRDDTFRSSLTLASLFTDQVPKGDLSRSHSARYGFPIAQSVRDSLTLGTKSIAVNGVLLVVEHGDYPQSKTGARQYPKRRLFAEVAQVFEESGKTVPIFNDKHLADNWKDARWIYDRAQALKIPLMAGSSIPSTWRSPPTDVKRGAQLKEIVGVSYGGLDSYGFHGLEMIQSLAERRSGGETGVSSVLCLQGDAVWEAARDSKPNATTTEDLKRGRVSKTGLFSESLLEKALGTLQIKRWKKRNKTVRESVKEPILIVINYRDGLRASLLTLNGAVAEWAAAWSYEDGKTDATLFRHMEDRPYHHFTFLLQGIEKMMATGRPTWPVERTLLTSGILDAALISQTNSNQWNATPYLDVQYSSDWEWTQPPDLKPNLH